MGVNGIEMSYIYNKVYSKIVVLMMKMSCDKLFHTGNTHTSLSLSKYTKFVFPFLVEKVLR